MKRKKNIEWVGFEKNYVIFKVGHWKSLCLLTRWVGGLKKGQKHAYVIFEWSLTGQKHFFAELALINGKHAHFL